MTTLQTPTRAILVPSPFFSSIFSVSSPKNPAPPYPVEIFFDHFNAYNQHGINSLHFLHVNKSGAKKRRFLFVFWPGVTPKIETARIGASCREWGTANVEERIRVAAGVIPGDGRGESPDVYAHGQAL